MEDIALKEVPARLASFILQLVESEVVMTAEGPRYPPAIPIGSLLP